MDISNVFRMFMMLRENSCLILHTCTYRHICISSQNRNYLYYLTITTQYALCHALLDSHLIAQTLCYKVRDIEAKARSHTSMLYICMW